MKQLLALLLALSLVLGIAPAAFAEEKEEVHEIVLSSQEKEGSYVHTAVLDGQALEEFDYVWHADPSEVHSDVKNSPAEYFTGDKPETEAAAYIAHDIYYYPELDAEGFTKVFYDDETEWAYYYPVEEYKDFIFATLPVQNNEVPTEMMHSEEEAYSNAVLHITKPGTYKLQGEWHGQIWIDLGDRDDTFTDENAKVTILLNGVDVTCTVAPSIVFYSLYECDNTWEDRTENSSIANTEAAGANVVIADGTVNHFTGTNVYRMLKTKYKDEEQNSRSVPLQKKARKTDGAFYSYVSLNIDGEKEGSGELNITAGFEGLGSELHLTLNGGNVNIFSQDDGINVNEDGVSVATFNGGTCHILAGLGSEGDGIDSNGFITVNGGTLISMANPRSDSGMDSDFGTYINAGTVVALGSAMDYAAAENKSSEGQAVMNLRFNASQNADEAILVTDTDGSVVFAYDPDKDEVAGTKVRTYMGAIVSSENIEIGKEYHVYIGGDVSGTEVKGVYDVQTVTGYSSDAKKQCYSSTGQLGGHGGFGGQRPEMPNRVSPAERPAGSIPGERPEGFEFGERGPRPEMPESTMPGERPEGFDFGERGPRPEMPEGTMPGERPEGFDFGGRNPQPVDMGSANTAFFMADKVNSFSGVTDWTEPADPQRGLPFTDVSKGDWYYEDVAYSFENGLMEGTSNTTFSPENSTSRAMIITILYRLEGSPEVTGKSLFTDVSKDAYYNNAVIWANEKGIVEGYDDGTFRPNQNITREQLAAVFYRYAQYKGLDVSSKADLKNYKDASAIHEYALDAMKWANGTGLIEGMNETILNPSGTAARSQTAAVFHRFCESNAVK